MPITTESPDRPTGIDPTIVLDRPDVRDGPSCRRLAQATGSLDVNSSYAYLLWCREFAATSVVARRDGAVAGFLTGFRRPDEPRTLFVWQVAVDAAERGKGVAAAMLDGLVGRLPDVDHVEASVTPGNTASQALFAGFADHRGARLTRTDLFGTDLLGPDHPPEILLRIGPIDRPPGR